MHRLLIVDDEIEVVEYFNRLLKKSSLTLELYTAYSAKQALEYLNRTRIDIILSDIKMPKMNGLEMYEIIKEKWPKCRVIFLSGVMNFDYVYESIQNRDVRYLTKLEPSEKIIATIKEVLDEIEQSYREKINKKRMQQQIQETLPLLRNQYMQNILYGIKDPVDVLQKKCDAYKINLNISKPVFMVGGIFDDLPVDINTYDFNKIIFSLKTIAANYFNNYYNYACYVSEQKYLIWFLQCRCQNVDTENNEVRLNGLLEYIQGGSRENIGLTITFVYDADQIAYDKISQCYSNIKRSLGYRSKLLKESIIALTTKNNNKSILWENKKILNSCHELIRIKELEGYLELGHKEHFFSLLLKIINPLIGVKSFNYNPALEVYYRVVCMFLKYINEWSMTETLAFKIDLYKLTRVDSHGSWQEAVAYLKKLAELIFKIHFKDENIWSDNQIATVQKYILENLNKDLSLITLAEKVNLNPSYLSRLFKKITKINLYDYILNVRMTKAKDMLRKTGVKINTIAESIGYESSPSFTRAFRKYTGITPSEYRDKQSVKNS